MLKLEKIPLSLLKPELQVQVKLEIAIGGQVGIAGHLTMIMCTSASWSWKKYKRQ
jgi:hypothetical protein